MTLENLHTAHLISPIGMIRVTGSERGIVAIGFIDAGEIATAVSSEEEAHPLLAPALQQLDEYFSGDRHSFDLELAPEGTDFNRQVWSELMQVPFGQRVSYLEIAERLGNPGAVRAVGLANSRNPIAIVVPCHRVVGSDGSLTGYAGGLWRKRWLLEHEEGDRQQRLWPGIG